MVTAYTHSNDKEKCFQCGADEFISKPISKEDILNCLKKYNLL